MKDKELIPTVVFLSLMLNEIETQGLLKSIRNYPKTTYVKKLIRQLHAADEKIRQSCFKLLLFYNNDFNVDPVEKAKSCN